MRVGLFIDTEGFGGAETVVLELAQALAGRGHEPILLHFGSPHLVPRIRALGIAERAVPGHADFKRARRLPRFARRFAALLRGLELDALHSHLVGPIVAAAPAARWAGLRHVGTLHDMHTLQERPFNIRLLQLAGALGTRLAAVSGEVAAACRAGGRFGFSQLETVVNGIAPAPPVDRARMRAALGVPPDAVVITCVGRMVELKCHRNLIEAFARLGLPNAWLMLVGDGPLRAELARQAEAAGAARQILFTGERSDVSAVLAASDLFTLASRTEGLSRSILEAMAAGLPAVVTRVGGNPELVADGESGLLVPPNDVAALAQALRTLAEDGGLRSRFGAAARQRVEAEFSLDRMAERYLALYAEELGNQWGRGRGGETP